MFIRLCDSCGSRSQIDSKKLVDDSYCDKCRSTLHPPPEVIRVSMKDLTDAAENQRVPILAVFTSPTCASSLALLKFLHKSAAKFVGKALVFEIVVDQNPGAAQLGVRGTPTWMLGKRGTLLHTHEGLIDQPQLDLWIREAIATSFAT
ncbi:MAG: thioredoxin family protein [Deltaproteobacteria bacterium]|nr:thioredoxin family protein [Deltaproteobacteria bacterium]